MGPNSSLRGLVRMSAITDDYFKLDDLAAEFGVCTRTMRRWARSSSPGLAITKTGRTPRVHKDDLAAWLQARRKVRNLPVIHRGRR